MTRDVQLRLAETLAASGDLGLRPGFAPLLERLRDGALPVGGLAVALGVTPQAASRSARTLEELGYVERTASAVDGRSRLVTLTARGHTLLAHAHETFAECEQAYALLIGRSAVDRILRDLEVLHFGLGLTPETGPVVHAPIPRSIGTCVLVTLHATRRVRQALATRGHGGLRPSHQELLLTVGPPGGRVSDAARAMRISRQAVSAMAADLEEAGYLQRASDATDRRAVVVIPTALGGSALDEMTAAVRSVEEECRAALGTARWARLERDLANLDDAVSATASIGDEGRPLDLHAAGAVTSLDLPRLADWLRTRLGPADADRLSAMLAPASRRAAGGTVHRRGGPSA